MAVAASLALITAVVASSGGCRAIVGIDDEPPTKLAPVAPDAEAPAACSASFDGAGAGAECGRCMSASCCAEAERCAANPSCAIVAGCIAKCASTDVVCAAKCREASAYGEEAAALASCRAIRCKSACAVTCGGYVFDDATCAACGVDPARNCCAFSEACTSDAECAALVACERRCPSNQQELQLDAGASCLLGCELAHPAGVAAQRRFAGCLTGSCVDSCVEPRWACLRRRAAPSAPGRPITITYRFVEYGTYDRAPGLGVRVCNASGLACGAPRAANAAGEASVEFPAGSSDGYAEVTGAGYASVRVYLPRVTRDFTVFVPVIKQPMFEGLASLVAPLDPLRAHVIVSVLDCEGGAADGVRLSIDDVAASKRPFYFDDQGPKPSPPADTTVADKTTGAIGGFLNVTPGISLTVRATRRVAQRDLAYEPVAVSGRAGTDWYSFLVLHATPP